VARADRRGPLVRAIVQAFHRAGFGSVDLLQGEIKHLDLPWQVPPLTGSTLVLEGLGLQEFIDRREGITFDLLYEFWINSLHDMFRKPDKVIGAFGWKRTSRLLHNTTIGDRHLRFCIPEGFPNNLAEYAGAMFSMEVAYTISMSRGAPLVQTASDFYVETPERGPVGVVAGIPFAPDSPWDVPVTGLIEALATSPRGAAITSYRHDPLARMRSLVFENDSRFHEAEALDSALQMLYFLQGGELNDPLPEAILAAVPQVRSVQRQIGIVQDCVEILQEWMANDRVKLLQLSERLVPEVLNKHDFAAKIWNFQRDPPLVMRESSSKKIRESLTQLRQDLIDTLPEAERSIYNKDQE